MNVGAITMDKRLTIVATVVLGVVCVASAAYYYTTLPVPAPLLIRVIPEEILDSYPGQRCVFFVAIQREGEGSNRGDLVDISATVPGASVTIEPQALALGQVAEVTVIPADDSANSNLTVTVTGERAGLKETKTSTIQVGGGHGRSYRRRRPDGCPSR